MVDSGEASLTLATMLSRKFFRLVCHAYPIVVSAQHRSIFGPIPLLFPEVTNSSTVFCMMPQYNPASVP